MIKKLLWLCVLWTPQAFAQEGTKAPNKASIDKILITKSKRTLDLLSGDQVVKTYMISLGRAPIGHKRREGDGKTPEGVYQISGRNPQSKYYRSLKLSYPNAEDVAYAREQGFDPGGDIMIHGLEDKLAYLGNKHVQLIETRGCVVVTNQEMEEIYNLVKDGVTVVIRA